MHTFQTIWRRYGFVPEALDLSKGTIVDRLHAYFLRPEMAESVMYLARATEDPVWVHLGGQFTTSIQHATWTPCGYAVVENVSTHALGDRMESFFLSETLKYLYLIFDDTNFIHDGNYVFTTEGHPFKVSRLTRGGSDFAPSPAQTADGTRTSTTTNDGTSPLDSVRAACPRKSGARRLSVRCAFFGIHLHSRMPLVSMPARLKLLHASDQWHSSQVSTASYRCHCKLCSNTEGEWTGHD
jgi:hypothetical protein